MIIVFFDVDGVLIYVETIVHGVKRELYVGEFGERRMEF